MALPLDNGASPALEAISADYPFISAFVVDAEDGTPEILDRTCSRNELGREAHLSDPAVAIIGAGPYGLSVAAYLRSEGVDFRIFGIPMQRWQAHMPKGMYLKSEGCASNLFDPMRAYTLKTYDIGPSCAIRSRC